MDPENNITIISAETAGDVADVCRLCSTCVADLHATHPDHRTALDTLFGTDPWGTRPPALRERAARPEGDVLLARRGEASVGCILYLHARPGVAEIERLFVLPEARGRGVGKALVAEALARMLADGYRSARLETASVLTQAQALFRGFGFSPVPVFRDHPEAVARLSRAFARDLLP